MNWNDLIKQEEAKEYYQNIMKYLNQEKDEKGEDNFYPSRALIFNALDLTPYEDVKVVIIGQDPYHEENQAHGLAFSVLNNKAPKSLQNMFKELKDDCDIIRTNPDLTDWAKQGVLLINETLTVQKHKANSHAKIGWHYFTDEIIKSLNQKENTIVFILLGSFAQSKATLIDQSKHKIIATTHPSFFSASKGFFGSKIFSRTNQILKDTNQTLINW